MACHLDLKDVQSLALASKATYQWSRWMLEEKRQQYSLPPQLISISSIYSKWISNCPFPFADQWQIQSVDLLLRMHVIKDNLEVGELSKVVKTYRAVRTEDFTKFYFLCKFCPKLHNSEQHETFYTIMAFTKEMVDGLQFAIQTFPRFNMKDQLTISDEWKREQYLASIWNQKRSNRFVIGERIVLSQSLYSDNGEVCWDHGRPSTGFKKKELELRKKTIPMSLIYF